MFKDDEEMEFEDFKRNLSKDPMGEYEQDELLESVRKNFPEKIHNKEVQKIYNEAINEPGPKKNDTKCLIVNFIDNDGESVLNLDEIDCKELAYVI